jgi:hypothetical protein
MLVFSSNLQPLKRKATIGINQIPTATQPSTDGQSPRNYPQSNELILLQRDIAKINKDQINLLEGVISEDEEAEELWVDQTLPSSVSIAAKPDSGSRGNYRKIWSQRETKLLKEMTKAKKPLKHAKTYSFSRQMSSKLGQAASTEEEDDEELLKLYKMFGTNWTLISSKMP